ncbi:MAG: RidA family protein [Filomicrobium sp.]
MTDTVLVRLDALNLKLPEAPAPVANYVPFLISGDLLFISGQISKAADGSIVSGRLGVDLTVEQGQDAARHCALNILAQAHAALGRLDRIAQVMKLNGYVNAAADFTDHPLVINGASDLMVDVLGDAGRHTRAAVGVSGLPANCAVEVDAILQIKSA